MRLVAVVNERARRGGAAVARMFERDLLARLPTGASQPIERVLNRSLDDLDRAAARSPATRLSGDCGGGDGTAIGLLNAVRARSAQRARARPRNRGSHGQQDPPHLGS